MAENKITMEVLSQQCKSQESRLHRGLQDLFLIILGCAADMVNISGGTRS